MLPQRILAIKLRAIGDTVLLTGVLRAFHRFRPQAEIHVIVRWPAGELLEGLPYVQCVTSVGEPKGLLSRFAYWFALVRRLRNKRYAMVLGFHASKKTAVIGRSMRTNLFVGNNHDLKGRNWLSMRNVPGRGVVKASIDRDLDLLRSLGFEVDLKDAMPELHVYPAETIEARKFLEIQDSASPSLRVFLGINASRETKRWPAANFVELARKLSIVRKVEFVVALEKSDAWTDSLVAEIAAIPNSKIIRLTGLRLRQVSAVINECQAYVGNDTGLKHIAAALEVPTVTVFGPEAPLEWHPYNPETHPYHFIEGLACRTETGKHWCPIETCPKYGNQCLSGIEPDRVLESVLKVLHVR